MDPPSCGCDCGNWEIRPAADQKWYSAQTKGDIDAAAMQCHDCRSSAGSI
ncbi:MAG: zinc-ribbon domain containing protein [Gammaproteobacteria bacterium]